MHGATVPGRFNRNFPRRSFFYYVLFLLLYWELLYVLLDVKLIVDLFLSFVEFFSWLDREFDKPMIFSVFHNTVSHHVN